MNEKMDKWTARENNAVDIYSFHLPNISLGKVFPKHSILVEQLIRALFPPLLYWPQKWAHGQANTVKFCPLGSNLRVKIHREGRWLALSYVKAILQWLSLWIFIYEIPGCSLPKPVVFRNPFSSVNYQASFHYTLLLLKLESVWVTYLQTTWTHTKLYSSWNSKVKLPV